MLHGLAASIGIGDHPSVADRTVQPLARLAEGRVSVRAGCRHGARRESREKDGGCDHCCFHHLFPCFLTCGRTVDRPHPAERLRPGPIVSYRIPIIPFPSPTNGIHRLPVSSLYLWSGPLRPTGRGTWGARGPVSSCTTIRGARASIAFSRRDSPVVGNGSVCRQPGVNVGSWSHRPGSSDWRHRGSNRRSRMDAEFHSTLGLRHRRVTDIVVSILILTLVGTSRRAGRAGSSSEAFD